MDTARVITMFEEAERYPLPVRIAAALHLSGVTYEELIAATRKGVFKTAGQYYRVSTQNALGEIERGTRKMTARLRELAEETGVNLNV